MCRFEACCFSFSGSQSDGLLLLHCHSIRQRLMNEFRCLMAHASVIWMIKCTWAHVDIKTSPDELRQTDCGKCAVEVWQGCQKFPSRAPAIAGIPINIGVPHADASDTVLRNWDASGESTPPPADGDAGAMNGLGGKPTCCTLRGDAFAPRHILIRGAASATRISMRRRFWVCGVYSTSLGSSSDAMGLLGPDMEDEDGAGGFGRDRMRHKSGERSFRAVVLTYLRRRHGALVEKVVLVMEGATAMDELELVLVFHRPQCPSTAARHRNGGKER